MVKRKGKDEKGWLQEALEDARRRRGDYIKSRYYVVEITPPRRYSYGDGHGGWEYDWTNTHEVRVSQYYERKEDADRFIEEHDPDQGKSLAIRKNELYRRTVEEWH